MPESRLNRMNRFFLAFGVFCSFLCGCQAQRPFEPPVGDTIPREFNRRTMPPYVIEPPDVIDIQPVSLLPKGPFRIQPLDSLIIDVQGLLPGDKISATFVVEPDGTVKFGKRYGTVKLAGLTLEEAEKEIEKQISNIVRFPVASVSLAETRALPELGGEHLVGQDGTVNMGTYGEVFVAGLTIAETREAIEKHLGKYFENPKVAVYITGYNSKNIYLVVDGGGNGYSISRTPITGIETVLDVLADIGGVSGGSSTYSIWIARPRGDDAGCDQIIPINIMDIVKRGRSATNYQLLPGDRLFIKASRVTAFENALARVVGPVERVMFSGIVGLSAIQSFTSLSTSFLFNPFGGAFVGPGFVGGF